MGQFFCKKGSKGGLGVTDIKGSTPNCPPYFHPGRSEEGQIKNDYEESQRTGDRDTRSSTVSGGAPDSPADGTDND